LADDLVQLWFFDMTLKKSVIKVTLIGSVQIFIFSIHFNSEPLKSFFGELFLGFFLRGASSFGVLLCLVFLFRLVLFGGVSLAD